MSKVWLVTGSSRGLGRDIAIAVLERGDRLVATARDVSQLADLVEKYGDRVRTYSLDVTDSAAANGAVAATVEWFGRIDVLVNNAGFGHIAPFEQATEADFRAQIETNFFGVVNLTRAVVPIMRAQGSGHIIQISSVGGRMGTPGLSAYQSAKWAVGGFTEVLAQELAPFGVKVTTLEPGGMRTGWGFIAKGAMQNLMPEYDASIGSMLKFMEGYVGHETGDPVKMADVVVEMGYHAEPPVHLLLGSDAYRFATELETARTATAERWKDVSLYIDFVSEGALPAFPSVDRDTNEAGIEGYLALKTQMQQVMEERANA